MEKNQGAYSNVLVAVDLSTATDQVIERALKLTDSANIRLVYVLDTVHYANVYLTFDSSDIEAKIHSYVRDELDDLSRKYGLSEHPHLIAEGRPATEVHRLVESLDIDLIVVGSHGRHGIQLMLGSTANSILHGATCDVLSVRIKKEEK